MCVWHGSDGLVQGSEVAALLARGDAAALSLQQQLQVRRVQQMMTASYISWFVAGGHSCVVGIDESPPHCIGRLLRSACKHHLLTIL